jgi:Tol biopolymer transport system component
VLVIVDIATGRVEQLGQGPGEVIGNEFPPVWSPDGKIILYQASGSRNYFAVNRATGIEHGLLSAADESLGWLFQPVFAPDGRSVIATWARPPKGRLWRFDLGTGDQRPIPNAPPGSPVMWQSDSLIYLADVVARTDKTQTETIIRQWNLATGQAAVIAQLPVDCLWGVATMAADAHTLVCPAATLSTDVWLSEVAMSR